MPATPIDLNEGSVSHIDGRGIGDGNVGEPQMRIYFCGDVIGQHRGDGFGG